MAAPMEFWGVEVKAGQSVKVDQEELLGVVIHLSQIALGESKKDKATEPVVLYLKVGDKKFVVGTLIKDDIPQISLDLYLESEFELSHNSKNTSVYFSGYKVENDFGGGSDFSDISDSDEEVPLLNKDSGKLVKKPEEANVTESKKPSVSVAASGKKVSIVDPKKVEEEESDDESSDEDDSGSSDEMDDESDSDDEIDSDDESDSDEETPDKKVDLGKKRPNGSASITPVPTKKAKNDTPAKSDGKKSAHTATPHPFKKGGKNSNKKGQRS